MKFFVNTLAACRNSSATAFSISVLLTGCSTALRYQIPADAFIQPETATGSTAKPGWATRKLAVAAASPLATDASYQVLKTGGSTLDAVIAVQMVLTLVEPQSSRIGGAAFLPYYNGTAVEAFDDRETAPAAADENLFLAAGQPPAEHTVAGQCLFA